MTPPRTAQISRKTAETNINIEIAIDGTGVATGSTGLGFLDHMLAALTRHAAFDLTITCTGDLQVDDHHTVEDVALTLGAAFDKALADRAAIARFASAYAPLDESLARAVIDLSGRPGAWIEIPFTRDTINDVATENITHFFASFATAARATLHIDLIRGENDHHKSEAAFKALALALRAAAARTNTPDAIPSTKGVLS